MSSEGPRKLVYMANQIAKFFGSQPGETAALKIADHINSFWTPTMRRELVDHVAETGGPDLLPMTLEATRLLRTSTSQGVERALAAAGDPSVGHQHGDDAG